MPVENSHKSLKGLLSRHDDSLRDVGLRTVKSATGGSDLGTGTCQFYISSGIWDAKGHLRAVRHDSKKQFQQ